MSCKEHIKRLSYKYALNKNDFPSCEEALPESKWQKMIGWIGSGYHSVEEEIKDSVSKDEGEILEYPEELYIADKVKTIMHAVFIVAVWSEMEETLKHFLYLAHEKKGEGKEFEAEYKFDKIINLFSKYGIKLNELPDYPMINGIRLLNNDFKHAKGRFQRRIKDPSLLKKWHLLDESDQAVKDIPYDEIDLEELALCCGSFIKSLSDKVKLLYPEIT